MLVIRKPFETRMRVSVPESTINTISTRNTAIEVEQESDHNKSSKMLQLLLFLFAFSGIKCEPETVRDNFDYFSYGNSEDVLRNLGLHMVRIK